MGSFGDKNPKTTKGRGKDPDAGIILLVFALLLFFSGMFLSQQPIIKGKASLASKNRNSEAKKALERIIEENLKKADAEQSIHRERVLIENNITSSTAEEEKSTSDDYNPLTLDQEESTNKVMQDIQGDRTTPNARSLTPDQRVNKKLERDEFVRDYDERLQEEYTRQFLENASESGYEVQLNEDLEVIGIRRNKRPALRIPQSEQKNAK